MFQADIFLSLENVSSNMVDNIRWSQVNYPCYNEQKATDGTYFTSTS